MAGLPRFTKSLRYTTFRPGELEKQLKALALKNGVVSDAPNAWDVKRRNPLHLRWHDCSVSFPDGTQGYCHYTRQGPRWHILKFRHDQGELPLVYHSEALGRDAASVESLCQEKAAMAFEYAIGQEQKDAKRVHPPWTGYGKRKADPATFQLSHNRAVALAGKYALCIALQPSGKLLPISPIFETISEANQAWRDQGNTKLVVAIAVR